jgi:hypothetical protein
MAEIKITRQQLKDELAIGTKYRDIAEKYGCSLKTVRNKTYILKRSGFDPENHRYHSNPDDQPVSGYSTLVKYGDNDPLGRVLEWVKTKVEIKDQLSSIDRLCKSMAQDVQPVEAVKYLGSRNTNKNEITVIPIGDPHVGLMTWKKEVGVDWDATIAPRVFKQVFNRLLAKCPDTEEVILVNTGDFFHADNVEGVTSRSRHKLDLDGRHGKWLDVGGSLLMMFIDHCLRKYKKVTFVNVPGNHDDILGRFLGTLAECVYRKEKRLTILKGDSPRQYLKRGVVGMGFAHTHLCKMKQLPQAFAMDEPRIWGETSLRMFFTGHVHHDQEILFKDNNGCLVTSAGIIPPADSYSHGAGYSSMRTIQAAILDTKYGELVSRPCATVRSDD